MQGAIKKWLTNLLVGRKHSETAARGLVLLRGTECPEGNRTTAKLSEPALELGLSGIMGQARHVEDLAALRQESPHIGASIHWSRQDVGVLMGRLRLANEASQNAGESDSLLHGAARRRRSQRLEVERQVVLDWSTGLDRLHLQGGTDIGQH